MFSFLHLHARPLEATRLNPGPAIQKPMGRTEYWIRLSRAWDLMASADHRVTSLLTTLISMIGCFVLELVYVFNLI